MTIGASRHRPEVGLFAAVESMVHHDLTERSARFTGVTVTRDGREI